MSAKNQRVHTHQGIDFIVVPGSKRERVLLDLFQAEDRLRQRPLSDVVLSDVPEPYAPSAMTLAVMAGFIVGAAFASLAWWLA